MIRTGLIIGAATSLLAAGSAQANETKEEKVERAAQLQALIDCRSINEAATRLTCYDNQVAALELAERQGEVAVFDKTRIRAARRTLFGLTLPSFDIFGSKDGDEDGVVRLESTLKQATQNADGRWQFVLDDGARWVQVDKRALPVTPRPGHSIAIRRAALGSYLANVNKQIAIRVQRVN